MAAGPPREASLQMTAAGMPAASSCSPSATAEALQEPQAPTPTTTTSVSPRNSSSISGGAGWPMLGLGRGGDARLGAGEHGGHAVLRLQRCCDLLEEVRGVALGVDQQAQPQPVEPR